MDAMMITSPDFSQIQEAGLAEPLKLNLINSFYPAPVWRILFHTNGLFISRVPLAECSLHECAT
ncbi:MAG: hypothetical protein DMF61_23275 [Blastocatellia bacterium AA13]|nr:MAG: hypothetical protein DMF61_23275 [Blastocatellia bacterium AA13]